MAAGVASVEDFEAASCRAQMAPTDPLQDTAESISQARDTLGKMCLTISKKNTAQAVRNEEKILRNSPVNTKFSCGGRAGAETPLQPLEEATLEQVVPCSPWRGPR